MNLLILAMGLSLWANFAQDKSNKTYTARKPRMPAALSAIELKAVSGLYQDLSKLLHEEDQCKKLLEVQAKQQLDLWKQAADAGNSKGLILLGECYALVQGSRKTLRRRRRSFGKQLKPTTPWVSTFLPNASAWDVAPRPTTMMLSNG
ncbi:MAG: hypothetical protein QM703_26165 [Gemmatales bacterium]